MTGYAKDLNDRNSLTLLTLLIDLTGLTDFSFEEIRLEAVKANASGTGAAYVSKVATDSLVFPATVRLSHGKCQ